MANDTRSSPLSRELLAFVLAGLLALTVVLLSGWGGDEEHTDVGAPDTTPPIARPAVDP